MWFISGAEKIVIKFLGDSRSQTKSERHLGIEYVLPDRYASSLRTGNCQLMWPEENMWKEI